MRVEKVYVCPTCHGRYGSQAEAEKCRSKHRIDVIEFCYCETCGAGWKVGYCGADYAAKAARECERKHKVDGDEEQKAAFSYFFTGGRLGKAKCVRGKI